jgi:hypothetical protein
MKERWLVVSNCQTVGLGNSLSLLCPQVEVDTCDIWQFRSEAEHWEAAIAGYDHLITLPENQNNGLVNFPAFPNVTRVPGIKFRGCHPDLAYVESGETLVKGPMDAYHSVIVLAAFKKGLSEVKARSLFTLDFYERAGFFSIWESEKMSLFESFESVGLNIQADFVKWVRSGDFMYSVNHPRINAVYDVATHIARKLKNEAIVECGIKPHDNLAAGPIYPVYPEIAERYGLGLGSYYFKPVGAYRVIDLDEFIAGSYTVYRNFRIEDLRTGNPHYDTAVKLIAEGI